MLQRAERGDHEHGPVPDQRHSWMAITGWLGVLGAVALYVAPALWATPATAPSPVQAAPGPYLPRDPEQGARLFVSKGCIQCHPVRGVGGSIGPDLGRATMGMDLTEIAAAMWNHAPSMALQMEVMNIERPLFEAGEMSALVAFLYYVNFGDVRGGDERRGEELFVSKDCSRCHTVGGRGTSVGPSLDDTDIFLSPVILAQRMWNHGPEMLDALRASGQAPAALNGQDLSDLIAYLRQQGPLEASARRVRFPGNARNGEDLFIASGCGSCHPVGGGRGAAGAPDLYDADLGVNVVELASRLWSHLPQMLREMENSDVEYPLFLEDEMADLLSYLYSIHYRGSAGDVERGAAVFRDRECASCHTLGEGENIGPDLLESDAARTLQDGIRALWNHAPRMVEEMASRGVSWPRLSGGEISDLLSYIRATLEERR